MGSADPSSLPTAPAADAIAPTITVRVRLFASLREAMGWDDRRVTLAASHPTPLALWRQLRSPAEDLPSGVRVAINQRFAHADTPLVDGDELAFLPPITGG